MGVVEFPTSCKPGNPATVARIPRQEGSNDIGNASLEPVIQSALGVLRESASLLFHIAGLGAELVSGPKTSRSKRDISQACSAAHESSNVVPLRNSARADS